MKQISYLLATFALIVLVGAGCASTVEPQTNQEEEEITANVDVQTKDATTDSQTEEAPNIETTQETKATEGLTLTATATEVGTVQLDWQVSDEISEWSEGYRLVRGTEINPEFPAPWWWERGPAHREKTWSGLPTGPAHFRVCAVKAGKCEIYSNDVEVIIN